MEARELIVDLVAKGLTQQQIAERSGLTQSAVSKVMRGDVADVMSRSYRRLQELHTEICANAGA